MLKGSVIDPPFSATTSAVEERAFVELDGKHFMTVVSIDGALRLARLLNQVRELSTDWHLLGNAEHLARGKIAHAVARALGGEVVLQSFQPGVPQVTGPRQVRREDFAIEPQRDVFKGKPDGADGSTWFEICPEADAEQFTVFDLRDGAAGPDWCADFPTRPEAQAFIADLVRRLGGEETPIDEAGPVTLEEAEAGGLGVSGFIPEEFAAIATEIETSEAVARAILLDILGPEIGDLIKPDARIVDDLDADSLDLVEVQIELEERGFSAPDEAMPRHMTVRDLERLCTRKVPA